MQLVNMRLDRKIKTTHRHNSKNNNSKTNKQTNERIWRTKIINNIYIYVRIP